MYEILCNIWEGVPSCYLELLDTLKNKYAGPLVFHLPVLLNPWIIVKIWPT